MVKGERKLPRASFIRALIPLMRTLSSGINSFSKASPSNIITLEIKLQCMNGWTQHVIATCLVVIEEDSTRCTWFFRSWQRRKNVIEMRPFHNRKGQLKAVRRCHVWGRKKLYMQKMTSSSFTTQNLEKFVMKISNWEKVCIFQTRNNSVLYTYSIYTQTHLACKSKLFYFFFFFKLCSLL